MREYVRHWQRGRIGYDLCVRWWLANPLPALWRWLRRRSYDSDRPDYWPLRTMVRDQGECYCPTGTRTRMRVNLFGCGFILWLSRSWTVRPCLCDKVIWLTFPENHQDEIEEYGLERLLTEFPEYRPEYVI